MKKLILIFGASGFVGTHINEKSLKEGFEVVGYDSKERDDIIKKMEISKPANTMEAALLSVKNYIDKIVNSKYKI